MEKVKRWPDSCVFYVRLALSRGGLKGGTLVEGGADQKRAKRGTEILMGDSDLFKSESQLERGHLKGESGRGGGTK